MLEKDSSRPFYAQLMDVIKGEIASEKLVAGSKLPNTLDLAEKYGVSHITVRQAMSGLVQEGLLARRPYHGTTVSTHARELLCADNGKRRLALLMRMDDIYQSTSYFRETIEGITSCAERNKCEVIHIDISDFDAVRIDPRLMGFILMIPAREQALKAKRLGLPTILVSVSYERSGIGFVRTDNLYGVTWAVNHLAELGHTNILLIQDDPECFAAPDLQDRAARRKAFVSAIGQCGLQSEGYRLSISDFENGVGVPAHTAIITESQSATLRLLPVLKQQNVSYPDDISIVAFDDLDLATHLPCPLTVVKQRLTYMGGMSLSLLLDENEAWRDARILVKPEPIIRESTRRI